MTDTKLLTEFMEKYGKRLNDEEKTLGDEVFMWLVYKLEEAQLQVFEDGKKAERERIIKMISKMQQEFKEATNDGGAVNYDAGVNATFDDVLAALTKE